MTECVPFLKVRNIELTIKWFEDIGFTCTATNHIWEPDCELNWARLEWKGAAFMLGPDDRSSIPKTKDTSIWFNVDTIDDIIENLNSKNIKVDIEPETFYGRKVVTFKDINDFVVSFSCELLR
ncbi:MAG: hypothetical protein H7122_19560 [Chitinophagaceae bacterium]|nr:hypothetical protein [Chitinophagaceae bacterium]